jgi:hypothetical protein
MLTCQIHTSCLHSSTLTWYGKRKAKSCIQIQLEALFTCTYIKRLKHDNLYFGHTENNDTTPKLIMWLYTHYFNERLERTIIRPHLMF